MPFSDKKTFEKWFHKYYVHLCQYAARFVWDAQATEDIVQNFYIALWEKKELSVTEESFLPYAYRAIRNSCMNYYRSELAKEDFYRRLTEEWEENLAEKDDFLYKEEVRNALKKLPEKSRRIFLLKSLSGLRYKEIAELTGITINTVKYHITEAFRILREELKSIKFFIFF